MEALVTPRLVLRPWRDSDIPPFAAMCADPRVMAHYPKLLTQEEATALAERIRAGMARRGSGLWAVEAPGVAPFIGYVGLSEPNWQAHFTPCVEIGWRLRFESWGQGYAREAAREALRFGFETAGLPEIVSFTVPASERSWRLMERLGMRRSPADDFDHPNLPPGDHLRRHVLYRARGGYFP
jgi:RimJ/RimL family protein N-acetyltransferase